MYKNAPDSFPNPFSQPTNEKIPSYDLELSKQRYYLVNSLFENMVTFNLEALQQTSLSLQKLTSALKNTPNANPTVLLKARLLLKSAQRHFNLMPVPLLLSQDETYLSIFTQKRKMKRDFLPEKQRTIEMDWNIDIQEHYILARQLAEQGLEMLKYTRVSVLDK